MQFGAQWKSFEDQELASERLSLDVKYLLLEALFEEAVSLGILPAGDPLEGLDVDIRVARAVNRVSGTPQIHRS